MHIYIGTLVAPVSTNDDGADDNNSLTKVFISLLFQAN